MHFPKMSLAIAYTRAEESNQSFPTQESSDSLTFESLNRRSVLQSSIVVVALLEGAFVKWFLQSSSSA